MAHQLTAGQILAYAELSHDHNPLHVDRDFAANSRFGGIVAHGFLILVPALEALAERGTFPKTLECRFQSPGRPGDGIACEVSADGKTAARFVVTDEGGEPRVEGHLRWR